MASKKISEQEKEKKLKTHNDLSKLLTEFIDKKELITKEAILMGRERIRYVKGTDLFQFFKDNFKYIKSALKEKADINLGNTPNEDAIQAMVDLFFENGLLLKVKKNENDKAKYPKRLFIIIPGKEDYRTFEEKKFYYIKTDQQSSKAAYVYLLIIIIIVLLGSSFQAWPLKAKIGFLWTVLTFLLFLLFLIVLSLIIAIIGIIFGYDILLFPNLLERKVSMKDRFFNPLVAYYPREDSLLIKLIRISMGIAIVILCVFAFINPSLFTIVYSNLVSGISRSYKYISGIMIKFHNRPKSKKRTKGIDKKSLNDWL